MIVKEHLNASILRRFRMTEKRFEIKPSAMYNNKYVIHDSEKEYTFPILDSTLNYMFCKAMNELNDENEQLKKENKKLHTKIFVMRTNIALERTEISRESYTGKKNAKEFLDDLEKW